MASDLRAVKSHHLAELLGIELLGRQEFEDPHWPLATRAPSHCRFCEVRRCWRRSRQQSATKWEELTAPPVGEKAKVPDARETPREHMCEKAAQKRLVSQRHHPPFAAMRVVFPAERDVGIGEIEEAVVRDRDPMCVSGQIMQNVLGTAEGALGIYDPIFAKKRAKESVERLLIRQ